MKISHPEFLQAVTHHNDERTPAMQLIEPGDIILGHSMPAKWGHHNTIKWPQSTMVCKVEPLEILVIQGVNPPNVWHMPFQDAVEWGHNVDLIDLYWIRPVFDTEIVRENMSLLAKLWDEAEEVDEADIRQKAVHWTKKEMRKIVQSQTHNPTTFAANLPFASYLELLGENYYEATLHTQSCSMRAIDENKAFITLDTFLESPQFQVYHKWEA